MGGIAQGVATKRSNDATKKANDSLTGRMDQSQDAYAFLRPQAAQSAQNIAQRVAGMNQPANRMLGEMTGGRYMMDLDAATAQSPLVMKAAPNAFGSESGELLGGSPRASGTAGHIEQAGGAGYDVSDLERLYEQQGGAMGERRDQLASQARQKEQQANSIQNTPLWRALNGQGKK
jgi:hypothetical protein